MKKKIKEEVRFYELSIFREIVREFKSHYNYVKRVIRKNSVLINNDIEEFRNEIDEKEHLFNRELTDPKEQNKLLSTLEMDNFLRVYYPSLIRRSMLLVIFSAFENAMRKMVKKAEEVSESRIKLKDLNRLGGDIEKFRRYLKLVLKVDFTRMNSEWKIIKELSLLRNFFAHFNGNFDELVEHKDEKAKSDIERVVKEYDSLQIVKNELKISDDSYLLKVIDNNISFLSKIARDLEGSTKEKSFEVTFVHYEDGSREKLVKEIRN